MKTFKQLNIKPIMFCRMASWNDQRSKTSPGPTLMYASEFDFHFSCFSFSDRVLIHLSLSFLSAFSLCSLSLSFSLSLCLLSPLIKIAIHCYENVVDKQTYIYDWHLHITFWDRGPPVGHSDFIK